MTLLDRVAIVCGAASGIGAAVADRFAREGAQVLACGMPQPAHAEALYCDVRQDEQVRAVVETALRRYGQIDVLVNAAGIVAADEAATLEDAIWQSQLDVNLGGVMRFMRAVLPQMLTHGRGSIVNIASVAAFNAGADAASCASAKAGVVALTRSAAQAYGARGVRVNALCPGWVDTPMAALEMAQMALELSIGEDEARSRTMARIALARMATPAEMAAACLFLASDESSFVTGTALVADGGMRVPTGVRSV